MVGNYTTSLVWTVKTELSVGSEVIILICPTRITFNYPLTQVGQHAAQLRSADFSLCYREPRGIIVLGRPSITDYTSDSRLSLLFTFLIRQWWGGSKKEAADSQWWRALYWRSGVVWSVFTWRFRPASQPGLPGALTSLHWDISNSSKTMWWWSRTFYTLTSLVEITSLPWPTAVSNGEKITDRSNGALYPECRWWWWWSA